MFRSVHFKKMNGSEHSIIRRMMFARKEVFAVRLLKTIYWKAVTVLSIFSKIKRLFRF